MQRNYCPRCGYPTKTCVCRYVESIDNTIPVIILQHPSEVSAAKGTVKLLRLVLQNCRVFVGESSDDFSEAKTTLESSPHSPLIVYPSEQATELAHVTSLPIENHSDSEAKSPWMVVLIDGTWRKAKKIIELNPWLSHYPHVRLADEADSNYIIRKRPNASSRSTLEAVVEALSCLEACHTAPLLHLFNEFQRLQLEQMPEEARLRYLK